MSNDNSKRKQQTLDAEIIISKYSLNKEFTYLLDEQNTLWLSDVIREMNEHNLDHPEKGEATLSITLNLKRLHNEHYQDHFLVTGQLTSNYQTQCVRCLDVMKLDMEAEFALCFLHSSFAEQPEFDDQDTIFADQRDFELYFFEKGKINLQEIIHEQVFLNMDYRPLHDESCKGLCDICGANLNNYRCAHARQKDPLKP